MCVVPSIALQPSVQFSGVSKGMHKKAAARGFFELLVLKSWDFIELQQREPFADIAISKTVRAVCAAAVHAAVL
jgi:chromatin segregation and condensation protein Rec8/ScpA/Scc1 (kleisin family)